MKDSKACEVAPTALFSVGGRATGRVLEIDRWLLRTLLKGVGSPAIGAALWDGKEAFNGSAPYRMTIRNRGALLRLIANPLLYFGDDYLTGNCTVRICQLPGMKVNSKSVET